MPSAGKQAIEIRRRRTSARVKRDKTCNRWKRGKTPATQLNLSGIVGTCHTSTATSKIKRSNGMCPAQKTPKSKTFKFVFLKWQPKPRKTFVIACFRKSAMKPVSAEFSSVLFSENRRGFKAFRTDNLPNGSVELLWLHKMMCPYKRTHLSYAATNFCNLGVGTRWQGSQTDSVKWKWDQVTILIHHPSTSFPNLYHSCFVTASVK